MSVWVLDQDSAREFYTGKLGFELTNDVRLDSGMRWMTARPQGNASQEFLLMDPSHSMLDSRSRLDPVSIRLDPSRSQGSRIPCTGMSEVSVHDPVKLSSYASEKSPL